MKHIRSSPGLLSGTDWRLLRQLELPLVAEADGVISAWLATTLYPFKLQMDFLSRVTKSAQDAAIRAITSGRVQMEFEHIHLRLFIHPKDLSKLHMEQIWGFFRIERVTMSTKNREALDHSIEFYLYLEG